MSRMDLQGPPLLDGATPTPDDVTTATDATTRGSEAASSWANADLARRTLHGAGWAFASLAVGKLLSLVALAVLARLLVPEDFGLLAFALVFITYVETLGDLGTSAALIYWPRRERDAAQLTFLVNALMGLVWLAAAWAAAPAIAAFFRNPAGTPVLRAMALYFPIKYVATTHDALLQKRLDFKARAAAEVGFAVAKAGVGIGLALAGFGVWSLVLGQLAGQALASAVLWGVVPWRPGLFVPSDLLAPMLRYGRGLVAVNVLSAVVHHVDLVIVGRMLGTAALGFYQVATKVPEMTITVLIWVVGKVLFPAFSKIHAAGQGLAALERAYLTALRYVSLLTLPAAVGLALLADPIVTTLFGPAWADSAPILRALAVYAGVRSLGTHAGDVLKATGRSGTLAGLAAVKGVLLVPGLLLAASAGPAAVAWTLAAMTSITALLSVALVCRLYEIPALGVARALQPGLLGAASLGAFLLGWRAWVTSAQGPAALATTILAGAATYLLTLWLVESDVYVHLRRALTPAPGRPSQEVPS